MVKQEYLNQPIVAEFIDWFSTSGLTDYPHSYKSRRIRKGRSQYLSFDDLSVALKLYHWPFNKLQDSRGKEYVCVNGSLEESTEILEILSTDLIAAIDTQDHQKFLSSAIALMKWGGTHRTRNIDGILVGNIPWLSQPNSMEAVRACIRVFRLEDDNRRFFEPNFRFNSGLTKLYSLVLPDFIIYDSRVAAALAWFTLQFIKTTGRNEIPNELKFACIRDSHGRNPSELFPYIDNRPSLHAHWNIRANWILSSVVSKIQATPFNEVVNPLRALEAALFMWGYEV